MVLCSMHKAILLLFRYKDSNDGALFPVSSARFICLIAAKTKPGKIY